MAAQRQIPGGPYVNETGTAQRQIPGGPLVNETISSTSTLSGTVVESSSDAATGTISFQHYVSGAVVESSADSATGTVNFQHYISGAVVESGLDSAGGVLDNPQAIVPKTGAGRPSRKRRRRIELDGRLYEVDERDVPALLEAVIRNSKPPGTAEIVEPARPSPKSPKPATVAQVAMPEPMSVDLVVERFAMLQQDLARQAEQDVLRMLDRVAQRVLAEVEDEDEALTALLLA